MKHTSIAATNIYGFVCVRVWCACVRGAHLCARVPVLCMHVLDVGRCVVLFV